MLLRVKKILRKIMFFGDRMMIKKTSTPLVLLASTFSAFILYKLFFRFSKIIWSRNINIDPNSLSPQVRSWVMQRDGIETYVLYVLVFTCIALTMLLAWLYDSLKSLHKKIILIFLFFAFIAGSWIYYSKIGFNPPMANRALCITPLVPVAVVMFILWLLIKIAKRREKIADLSIILFLIPICFIATSPISPSDYSYIFAPALRLLKHFEIKDIYFQYDLLLSFIAAIWMKLNINLNFFQILGQLSFYVLFLVSFFFSKRFFINRRLSYYLLVSLVLVKIYGLICDPVFVFQVTPLRLDWWLLILIISFASGVYNKLLGIALGILIIFHRTFGLIYAIGYLEIISVLFLLDFMDDKILFQTFKTKIKKHFSLCLPNVSILIISFIISLAISGTASLEAASTYQKIGIGFLPISAISFYWYFPVLASATVVLLIKKRKNLSINYFNSSLLLVALSIGNSIYFFGRSHENNIINVSASLIFVLFLFFDLLFFQQTADDPMQYKWRKIKFALLPGLLVLMITFFYSAGIIEKSHIQYENILKHQTIYPMPISLNISKVRQLTGNSDKVYFTGIYDFYYYYYGNYTPQGRFSPYMSWVYKKDMIGFMQNLLNDGYYIVSPGQGATNDPRPDDEILSELRYNKDITENGFRVVWNGV
jgi:hypothetical protein